MILCSVIKPLDFLIHGAHFPANLPHRYTFIYSFILLVLAFKAFKNIKDLNVIVMLIFSWVYIAIIGFTENILVYWIEGIDTVLSTHDIFLNIILMGIYLIAILLYKFFILTKEENSFKNSQKIIAYVLPIISFLGLLITFFISLIYSNKVLDENEVFSLQLTLDKFKESLNDNLIPIILVVVLISLISCILLGYIIKTENKFLIQNIVFSVLLVIVSAEATLNSFNGFLYNGGTNKHSYVKYIDDTENMLNYIKKIDKDENKFYRQEFRRFTTINDASLYHYNGFSQFSSLAYGDTSKLIELLGIAATSNSYRYYDPTPLINAMFNIKYVMNKDGVINNPDYEYIADFNTVSLYKNPKHLSLAFMVDKDIQNWEVKQDTPFLTQNEFIKKSTNVTEPLTIVVPIPNFRFENITVTPDENVKNKYSYKLKNETDINFVPKVNSSFVNPKTQRLFLYVEAPNASRFKYTIDGHTQDREISTGRSLIDIGILERGKEVKIEFSLNRKGEHEKTYRPSGSFKLFAAGFEEEVFEKAYSQLEDEMLIVENYTSSKIEGKINVLNDGILFTSIPYDKAWKAFVDGKEVETLKIANNGLIGINLSKGEHNIVFKYKTSGFTLGIFLTLISIISTILYVLDDKKANKHNAE